MESQAIDFCSNSKKKHTPLFHLDTNKKAKNSKHVIKLTLKKKMLLQKPLCQGVRAQLKSKGIKWLESESELTWVTYNDIKKAKLKPIYKLSELQGDIEMI